MNTPRTPVRAPLSAPRSALIVGFARTGQSVAEALMARGAAVVAIDDAPSSAARSAAKRLGVVLFEAPDAALLAKLVHEAERVVVSPGVPPHHQVFALARSGQLLAEIELAYQLSALPVLAVTGTNGKTTVTELVAAMLVRSGRHAVAAGNIGLPLIEAIDEEQAELVVAEVSSFQLKYTSTFAPRVATYLNLAEDHLDWHPSMQDYADSKARIFAFQGPDDVAVVNGDEPVVYRAAAAGRARVVTFGAHSGDFHEDDGTLVGPSGEALALVEELPRHLPHDRMNALAALATALEGGAERAACREALKDWVLPPHRVELVANLKGVAYYDDSKATTPSAVIAALRGFDRVVLIAGGRNKGLDLSAIARSVAARGAPELRGIVAIGEAAGEVAAAFQEVPLRRAQSMSDAVREAEALARPGDAVLLSPGCASFDWYSSYVARGEDFKTAVRRLGEQVQGAKGVRS